MSSRLPILNEPDRSAPEYWRSLAERLEVPRSEGEWAGSDRPPDGVSRRSFLGYLGASMALAGATACRQRKPEKILPYSRQPSDVMPGIPSHYATAMCLGGHATGLVIASREGRPIKVEGNPEHPASLGASGAIEQASLLQLYDPDRAADLHEGREPRSYDAFAKAFAGASSRGGAGLHFLLEPTGSPLIADRLAQIRRSHPEAEVHFFDPLAGDGALIAAKALFGRPLIPRYRLERAKVIVSLDSNLLAEGPFHLRHARDFASGRRPGGADEEMNRLYVFESGFTPTGATADHRYPVQGREVAGIGLTIAGFLLPQLEQVPEVVRALAQRWTDGPWRELAQVVARDLLRARQGSLLVAGERQPAETHLLAAVLNQALGSAAVEWAPSPILEAGGPSHDLARLAEALEQGRVESLLILGGNPAYSAPADLELAARIGRARRSLYLGLYENETAAAARWFVPEAHYLESWGDGRALDGTVSLVQPLIEPLHGGRTPAELLSAFVEGDLLRSPREVLLRFWRGEGGARSPLSAAEPGGFQDDFDSVLQHGLLAGSAIPAEKTAIAWPAAEKQLDRLVAAVARPPSLELAFQADARVRDGAFTNVPWLLELPEPIQKLTWENAVVLGPKTAAELTIATDDWVVVKSRGRAIEGRALVLPGQADGVIGLSLGFGRSGAESNARGRGYNAYALRTREAPSFDLGPSVRRLRGPVDRDDVLAITQQHWSMEGRPLVLEATLAEYRRDPKMAAPHNAPQPTLRASWPKDGPQWAMSIDLSTCIGCNACVVACQAENNVPVVGKHNVIKSREMHWLRLDRYFSGPPENPTVLTQPMFCQQCERAPCEYVCPVEATAHSPDGINEMVYNRCVGTRFCSNNCPYKVRRFNWLDFNLDKTPLEILAMNPEVTVRERGVMEKCTYCVQRVRNAGIAARIEGRPIHDGEVVTACAQACPTQALVFGDMNDPKARVAALRKSDRAYGVLSDLGTEPRTRYLMRITNPNPELAQARPGARIAGRNPP